jgi:hypothetical protein
MVTARSLRALDWMNFFVANVQTGFGPFIASYLASHKWTQGEIGMALSVGTISAMVSQVPGGAAVDALAQQERRGRLGDLRDHLERGAAGGESNGAAGDCRRGVSRLCQLHADTGAGRDLVRVGGAREPRRPARAQRALGVDRQRGGGRIDGRIRRILFAARGVLADCGARGARRYSR